MQKRLAFLEKMAREGSTDPFVGYGLAMEYRSLSRADDALATFRKLRADHPDYVPGYLMCAQLLAELARKDEAREWLETGIGVARKKGDAHAASEMQDALDAL